MGRIDYLAMKTDAGAAAALLDSDFAELKIAAKNLISGRAVGTSFLRWMASFAAILAADAGIVDSSAGGFT